MFWMTLGMIFFKLRPCFQSRMPKAIFEGWFNAPTIPEASFINHCLLTASWTMENELFLIVDIATPTRCLHVRHVMGNRAFDPGGDYSATHISWVIILLAVDPRAKPISATTRPLSNPCYETSCSNEVPTA